MNESLIGERIIGSAIAVHRALGPGLLESAYEFALSVEFSAQGLRARRQVPVPLVYRGERLELGFRADFIVEERVIVELKSVDAFRAVFGRQVLTYLRLSGCRLGYVLNFGLETLRDGIERVVDGLPD